jgi:hypothetical protein
MVETFQDNEPAIAGKILREYIERDAPVRERSVATWMVGVSCASAIICLGLYKQIGIQLSLCLACFLGVVAAYYIALICLLRQDRYHRAIAWINALIEVSIPSAIFIIDWTMQGAEFALTAPVVMIWGTLIAVSGLRMSSSLAISAGCVAALQYLVLYYFLVLPVLPPNTIETLQPAMIATRAFLLVCSGIITAIFARHLLRKAEDALGAVRERDWMGRYLIHERIGIGGMAEVFRATYAPEGGFEKRVALKRVLPKLAKDPRFSTMFRAEAELGSWLAHPHIVQTLDLGSHNDDLFLALEFVDGITLKRLLELHPNGLPTAVVAYIALCISKALEYTHTFKRQGRILGLVHQDVNPPNILVSRQGEVKLSDFGIVRAINKVDGLEKQGELIGKPSYLAPEQLTGGTIDGKTDLFSLGLTMYECLTGRHPLHFAERADIEQTHRIGAGLLTHRPLEQPVYNPQLVKSEIPEEIARIIMKLTEQDVSKRYSDAGSVIVDLQKLPPTCAPSPASETMLAVSVEQVLESSSISLDER